MVAKANAAVVAAPVVAGAAGATFLLLLEVTTAAVAPAAKKGEAPVVGVRGAVCEEGEGGATKGLAAPLAGVVGRGTAATTIG